MRTSWIAVTAASLLALPACAADTADDAQASNGADLETASSPQDAFWANLQALCGGAHPGEPVETTPGDDTFTDVELIMHVRECDDDEIKIPFHVGDNHSRTWVFTRTDDGLRLKHDHRYEDGSEEELTQYGGDTAARGTENVQEFPADEETVEMLPEAATNIWTVEVHPGESYIYALRREGTDRRVRVRFDLTEDAPTPPAPWGHD